MTRFAYYAPFFLGLVLGAGIALADGYENLRDPKILFLIAISLPAGLVCQLVFVGVQGAFAQVLPVPIGRSIRGRGAFVVGTLILLAAAAAAVAWLIAMDEITRGAIIAMIVGAVCALCAAGGYIWCLPAASRDFDRV